MSVVTASRRILVLGSSAGGGDWPPLVAVASALIGRGHDVTFLGDARLADATRGGNLRVEAVPAGRDFASYIGPWLKQVESDPTAPMPIGPWTADVAPLAVALAETHRPDLLLCTDFTFPLGDAVRSRTRAPVCLVHSTFYVGTDGRRRIEDDFAPAHRATGYAFASFIAGADLVLVATDASFDPPPDPPPPSHHWVGPLIWEPVLPTPEYVRAAGKPWALVTMSSDRQPGEVVLARAALAALADAPLRTLLTLGDPKVADDLGSLPTRVRIETFAPHSPILERAGLCVSHAGHGIVSKALYFGVPMVLIPWDRDQPGVAARAEALGVARVVRKADLSPPLLSRAIREVLADRQLHERVARHGERLRSRDARATACERIERFLGPA